jgi:hypothetical protein
MPQSFDLLFITPDDYLSEVFLLEEVGAIRSGPAKSIAGEIGELWMIPYVEAWEVLANEKQSEPLNISVNDGHGVYKAWSYAK